MQSEDNILKAKVQLILDQPFFATLALRLAFIPDNTIKTASTNGKAIRYNPGYIESLSLDEVKGVIVHEVMHITLLHHSRRSHRDLRRWNIAADYAINPIVIDAGFVLPEGALLQDAYRNKNAEQIYDLLPPDLPGEGKDKDGDTGQPAPPNGTGTGDIEDPPPDVNCQELDASIKQTVAMAAMQARRQGKMSQQLDRLITELLTPKIDWQEVLARFVTQLANTDYTWTKPSPRYLYSGLYLPKLESTVIGSLILIIDTSISIDRKMLDQFASEVQDITSTFQIPLKVLYVDETLQGVQDIDADTPIHLEPKGGGGTDFRPGFAYIEAQDEQPGAVIYFTDGICDSFPDTPDYPVLWAIFDDFPFEAPFGETIQVA